MTASPGLGARPSLRVIFAGTPEFARVALEHIHAAGFELPLVLTQPDRPAGRGMKLHASAVKQYAQAHGMPLAQPRSLRLDGKYPEDAAQARAAIESAQADVMVVVAYGLILPQWVLDTMERAGPRKLGCLNIHASLLPRWRGAAPIHRAIEAGDVQTGVTIMQMDAGLDTGPMLLVQALPIEHDTTGSLHDRLALLGARMGVEALHQAANGALHAVPQPVEGVSYAHKIEKAEAVLDWSQSAQVLERRIRAFDPFPGASSVLLGEPLKVWAATLEVGGTASTAQCGEVLSVGPDGICVQCGGGEVLRITALQRAGGKRLGVADFLRGFELPVGTVWGV